MNAKYHKDCKTLQSHLHDLNKMIGSYTSLILFKFLVYEKICRFYITLHVMFVFRSLEVHKTLLQCKDHFSRYRDINYKGKTASQFDRLVQERCNSITYALQLHLAYTKPLNCLIFITGIPIFVTHNFYIKNSLHVTWTGNNWFKLQFKYSTTTTVIHNNTGP